LIQRCSQLSRMWHVFSLCLASFKWLTHHTPGSVTVFHHQTVLWVSRISAGFMFSLVRSLTIMHYAIAKGTTCSLIMIMTDKNQADKQRYAIRITVVPP
jgi:hypothetical protein